MKYLVAFAMTALLASCGADGAPFVPTGGVGVSVGPNGVSTSTNVGVSNGAVSVGLSF